MGYKLDHDYELFAIVLNRKPDACETCPFFGHSIRSTYLGYCTPLDKRMQRDDFTTGTLGTCPIKIREEMEAHT
jgi:hypothetical protein